ncbi:hypothetical protein, partial [Kribbella solani]|uniref:hypothetical protein n=1 Tax=Kribbella solani TaxID=236067 RepID=UPI0029A28A69
MALPTTATANPAADPTATAPTKLFTVRDDRLKETTGLAKSVKHDGIYWAVSRSGDTGRVFAVDQTGKVKAVLRISAKVVDVEAVGVDRNGFIYLADIGDTKGNRDQIEVYTFPEPETLQDQDKIPYHRYDYTYPDGAHDAETLLIEPGTSQLYFVTRSSQGAGAIYSAPPSPSRQGTNKLTKFAAAPSGGITDGTFLPDGQRAVLRSATEVSTVAWGDTPTVVARVAASTGAGKSVAVGPADGTVVVASSGTNAAFYQLTAPAKPADTTTSTPPSASATPKPATASDSSSSTAGKSHNLRWIIIGAAAFAILITVLTFPPGRRERGSTDDAFSLTHLRAPKTRHNLVSRLRLKKKKYKQKC